MLISTTKHKHSLTEGNTPTCAYVQMLTFPSYKYTPINYFTAATPTPINVLISMHIDFEFEHSRTHTSALKYHDTNLLSYVQVHVFTLSNIPAHIYAHIHSHTQHTQEIYTHTPTHPLTHVNYHWHKEEHSYIFTCT